MISLIALWCTVQKITGFLFLSINTLVKNCKIMFFITTSIVPSITYIISAKSRHYTTRGGDSAFFLLVYKSKQSKGTCGRSNAQPSDLECAPFPIYVKRARSVGCKLGTPKYHTGAADKGLRGRKPFRCNFRQKLGSRTKKKTINKNELKKIRSEKWKGASWSAGQLCIMKRRTTAALARNRAGSVGERLNGLTCPGVQVRLQYRRVVQQPHAEGTHQTRKHIIRAVADY